MTQQEFTNRYSFDIADSIIGAGGFGTIYKAYDNYLDKWIAIKLSKNTNDDYRYKQFKREYNVVQRLMAHKNIATYENYFSVDFLNQTHECLIMHYYSDGNLNDVVIRNRLSARNINDLLMQILEGLKYLHLNKILHLDIKPSNILIVKHNNVFVPKIADFGNSMHLEELGFNESKNLRGVSMAFSSPELKKSSSNCKANSDLWSFGILAFWMFTGSLPFDFKDRKIKDFFRINFKAIDHAQQIPEAYKILIKSCLIENPNFRIFNVDACLDILRSLDILSDEPLDIQHNNIDESLKVTEEQDNIIFDAKSEYLNLHEKSIEVFCSNNYSSIVKVFPNFCKSCSTSLNNKIKSDWDPDYGSSGSVLCQKCGQNNNAFYLDRTFTHICNNCGIYYSGDVSFCSNCGIPKSLMFNAREFLYPITQNNIEAFFDDCKNIKRKLPFYSINPKFPLIIPINIYNDLIKLRQRVLEKIVITAGPRQLENYERMLLNDTYIDMIARGTPFYNGKSTVFGLERSNTFIIPNILKANHKVYINHSSLEPFPYSDSSMGFVVICQHDTSLVGYSERYVKILSLNLIIDIMFHKRDQCSFIFNNLHIFFSYSYTTFEKKLIKVVDLNKEYLIYHHYDFEKSDFGENLLMELAWFENVKEITLIGNNDDKSFNKISDLILIESYYKNGSQYINDIKINITTP